MGLFDFFKSKKEKEAEAKKKQEQEQAEKDKNEQAEKQKESKKETEPSVDQVKAEANTEESVKSEPAKTTEETTKNQVKKEPVKAAEETTENQNDSEQVEPQQKKPEKVESDSTEYDQGLKKTRNSFMDKFNKFMANFRSVDEDFFDDLEDLLIESDVGYDMTMKISDALREEVKLQNVKSKADVTHVIIEKMAELYREESKNTDYKLNVSADRPLNVILFVGVNGAGKTTTIGKLAARYKAEGKKVLLAAGDTFRAGAIEQLQEWGKRDGVRTIASKPGTDPASVVFDALQVGKKEHYDILLVDTAGRLQNNTNLMQELAKIKRIITREIPDAPHEVLLVIDATTGQNALSQAKQFQKVTDVTGLVLTKLDGTSQGGIVLSINNELHIPVKLVGLGEKVQDLRDFDPEKYSRGLFSGLATENKSKK